MTWTLALTRALALTWALALTLTRALTWALAWPRSLRLALRSWHLLLPLGYPLLRLLLTLGRASLSGTSLLRLSRLLASR